MSSLSAILISCLRRFLGLELVYISRYGGLGHVRDRRTQRQPRRVAS